MMAPAFVCTLLCSCLPRPRTVQDVVAAIAGGSSPSVDTFVFQDGMIRVQTVVYTVGPA